MARRLALISGGTSGIGREAARVLARDSDLALIYRKNKIGADAAVRELEESGSSRIIAYGADLKDFESARIVMDRVRQDFGVDPTVLVHSSGGLREYALFAGSDFGQVNALLQEHLVVGLALARLVLPGMYRGGAGRIVYISSIAARYMIRGRPCEYAAAKGGIEAFTRALAQEVAAHGITVNAVAPGLTNTRLARDHLLDLEQRRIPLKRKIPVGAAVDPADVGELIGYLCSMKAKFITGETITIDGGQSIGDTSFHNE